MARLIPLLFLAQIVLVIFALISCISANDEDLRGLPKLVWVLIILFFPLVGSIAYFVAGRPVTTTASSSTWRAGSGFPEAKRPGRTIAPDDDPEFLRSLRKKNEKRKEPDDKG